MDHTELNLLSAEINELNEIIAAIPPENVIVLNSFVSRLEEVMTHKRALKLRIKINE